jgi:hypothetical protein
VPGETNAGKLPPRDPLAAVRAGAGAWGLTQLGGVGADAARGAGFLQSAGRVGSSGAGKFFAGLPYGIDAAQLINENVLPDNYQIPWVDRWAPGQFDEATTFKPEEGLFSGYAQPMLEASNHPIRSLYKMDQMLNPVRAGNNESMWNPAYLRAKETAKGWWDRHFGQ